MLFLKHLIPIFVKRCYNMNKSKSIDCPHCDKKVELDRYTKECSNCFGCVGCEQHVCPNCKQLIIIEPPRHLQKKENK